MSKSGKLIFNSSDANFRTSLVQFINLSIFRINFEKKPFQEIQSYNSVLQRNTFSCPRSKYLKPFAPFLNFLLKDSIIISLLTELESKQQLLSTTSVAHIISAWAICCWLFQLKMLDFFPVELLGRGLQFCFS